MVPRSTPDRRAELTIVVARIVLAGSTLFALWLDRPEPDQYTQLTYVLHLLYVLYALVLVGVVWLRPLGRALPLVTHVIDIVVFSSFHVLTHGPSSPFYAFFLFSMFCGALRWGWKGTVNTAAVVLTVFVAIGLVMSIAPGPAQYEVNLFVIRSVYLAIAAALLVYLGLHEARLRGEVQRLADWPKPAATDAPVILKATLAHAAEVVGAERAVLLWDTGDEPWVHGAVWQGGQVTVERISAEEWTPAMDAALDPRLRLWLGPGPVISSPLPAGRIAGRVYFSGLQETGAHADALTEVVARELAWSLAHMHRTEELRQIAAREERIAVSRDLHDGVLQALTGIRLELQSIGDALSNESRLAVQGRMADVERALAVEQRELRSFIEGLRPAQRSAVPSLPQRLEDLRNRLAPHRNVSIDIRLTPADLSLPPETERALLMMVHEAVANALKHASPSRIVVEISLNESRLQVNVIDDGRGFAFEGRYNQSALERNNIGPVTLRERAAQLGGELSVETSKAGSRIELVLPIEAARRW